MGGEGRFSVRTPAGRKHFNYLIPL